MNAEDFELAVAAIILLQTVGKGLKENLENNGLSLYLKRGKRK